MEQKQKKILLGMLVSNGDCLMATVLARQIKSDFPGCHLTWAISQYCRSMIDNNPDVDAVWEVRLSSKEAGLNKEWKQFRREADRRKERGEFDETFFTQIYPDNVHCFDGTTRGTIYNAYPHPVTVPARPVLRLRSEEKEKVAAFAEKHGLSAHGKVILFECSSFSGQSFVNAAWALELSRQLADQFPDLAIVISTHETLVTDSPRIIIASEISLRENVALSHYCSLLVGCSSGVTWICTSEEARRIPMVQFLKRAIGFSFASVAYDHAYWGLPAESIIETSEPGIDKAKELITLLFKEGVSAAKSKYHRRLTPRWLSMFKYAFMFLRRGKVSRSAAVVRQFIKRNLR